MKQETPSPEFTARLMQAVERVARRKARLQKWGVALQIFTGTALIVLLPFAAVHFLVPEFSLPDIKPDVNMLVAGTAILALLTADTLLRRRLFMKKHNGEA
jgi:hypothetical protein